MNYKILRILIPVIIIAAISIGVTVSYFQDVEKSENNVFKAGTLDLYMGEEVNAIWEAENMLPGDEVEGELEFENKGSLPIKSLLMEVEIEQK